jgi:uncharacterized protein YjbI with pentapeptide repeats
VLTARQLTDLPYAAALRPHVGGLGADGEYDTAHFDRLSLDQPDAPGTIFLECAFTGVTLQGGSLRRARFGDVWLSGVRITLSDLAETQWADGTFAGGVLAGVQAFGARLDRVVFAGVKLDSVNFRDAELTGVTFTDCLLRDVDFAGATLTQTSFGDSRLSAVTLARTSLDQVDLRGAELGILTDATSLRGAIVTSAQLTAMAPLLAETLGIVVADR